MPTYSYRCDTCGHEFDASQRFSDEPLKECPECGAAIRRVIQPVGVVFKGSGWYITDSRGPDKGASESDKPAAKKDTSDGKEAAPAKESAKETSTPSAATADKPAAKAVAD
jgi:putative FmdB family regulatory protein